MKSKKNKFLRLVILFSAMMLLNHIDVKAWDKVYVNGFYIDMKSDSSDAETNHLVFIPTNPDFVYKNTDFEYKSAFGICADFYMPNMTPDMLPADETL